MARGRSSGLSKGSLIQRPFTGGSWPKAMVRSMNSTGRQYLLVPGTIFHRGHEWNTIRDTTPPMYLTRTDIRSRSSIKANDGIEYGPVSFVVGVELNGIEWPDKHRTIVRPVRAPHNRVERAKDIIRYHLSTRGDTCHVTYLFPVYSLATARTSSDSGQRNCE